MPRYRIVEQRMYESTYIVEAEDEASAKSSTNVIEEENDTDSWGYDTVSVELIEEDDK